MAKKRRMPERIFGLSIFFPNATKKAKEKDILFTKLLSLLADDVESLPIKISSKKGNRQIVLDSDNFTFTITLGKQGSLVNTRLLLQDIENTIDNANEIGNKVINSLNTILGESVFGSSISSHKSQIYSPTKSTNLAKKLLGDHRMARINEEVKQVLEPFGIMFEYKLNDREFTIIVSCHNEEQLLFISNIVYKGNLPFDLLQKEYDALENPRNIVNQLKEMEL